MTKKLDLGSKPKKTRKKAAPKKKMGLGDAVEKVTKATGIKKAVDIFSQITGADCGCEERKEKLNNLFKRKKMKARCITKDEYYQLTTILEGIRKQIKPDVQRKIAKLYSGIFGTRYEVWCDSCPEIWKSKLADLQGVVDVYKKDLEAAQK